jgi:CHAT domain-containing protein/Tfp pilus assembly protein PilF
MITGQNTMKRLNLAGWNIVVLLIVSGWGGSLVAVRAEGGEIVVQTVEQKKAEADRLAQKATKTNNNGLQEKHKIDQEEIAYRLNKEGFELSNQGQQKEALQKYEQAIEIARRIGVRKLEGIVINNMGLAFKRLNKHDDALKLYDKAIKIYQQIKCEVEEGITLNNIANIYKIQGNISRSLHTYQRALELHRRVQNKRMEVITLLNIGAIYNSPKSEYLTSLDYFKNALMVYSEISDRTIEDRRIKGAILREVGVVFQSLGRTQQALDKYNDALAISKETDDRQGEGFVLGAIGNLYYSLGQYQIALDFHQNSLLISQDFGNASQVANDFNNIALAHFGLGQYEKAKENLKQALTVIRKSGDITITGLILNNFWFLENGNSASSNLMNALLSHRKVGNRPGEAKALATLAALLAAENNLELATIFYKKSVNVYETIREEITKLPRDVQESYTSSVGENYRSLADLLLRQERNREAQVVLELLKVQESRNYDRTSNKQTSPVLFPLHPLEVSALQAVEQTLSSQSLTAANLTLIGQSLAQNHDRITQEMNNSSITIGNPQAILNAKPNVLFIQNLVVDNKLWVLWTNANGITKAIALPSIKQTDLVTRQQEFTQQIGSPYSNINDLKANGKQLYDWLIPPQLQAELQQAPKSHLIFSLDHVTRYIPIAALHDGTQYLAQRYTISNLTTTDTNMSDRLSTDRTARVLALGTSKAYPGFSALPNVDAEVHAIVRETNNTGLYPGNIYLNETFTADRLNQNLDSYRVLHIATHGVFNPKSITESFLLLGNGDRLPISNIATFTNLNNTHLVVLSACQTGLSGQGQDGTEISGISGYFLQRGAKSVLASLWKVNDASTALMMQQFYKHLADGQTKAEAIQKVQQDFISGKLTAKDAPNRSDINVQPAPGSVPRQVSPSTFAHPYYWAPFILIGNSL